MILLSVIIAIYFKYQPTSRMQFVQNEDLQSGAEEIAQKLQSTQLTQKIIVALRTEGYHPDGTIEYLIDSSGNQIITIYLHNIDKLDSRTESKIQKIITSIANKNNFNLFLVDVQLTDVD